MTLRKVLLTALVLAVVAVPMTSQATVTRVIGLGGSDANFIVKDAYNSAIWPQLVKHYGMQSGAEFYTSDEGWDFQKAYINYDFGDDASVLQFALDKLNYRDYGWMAGNALSRLDDVPGGYNKLNVTYGRPMGDDMLIGLGLHYAGKTFATNEDGGNIDDSYSEIGLLLGLTAMEEKLDVSLGFQTGSWTVEEGGSTVAEGDGASSIMIAGRYWHEASDSYKLIPSLAIGMHTDNAKAGDVSNEYSSTMFRLGVGNNWTPKDDMLAIAEFGIQSYGETMKMGAGEEVTDSELDIFWRLGIESKIFSWLHGRFGAERAWVGATWESVPGQPEWSSSVTSTFLGATAHWNRFQADLLVNPSFLGYGPNFVSGYNDMIFTQASVKINFDQE